MNRHGQRFVNVRELKLHTTALKVRFLNEDELEFYEEHCLLLPIVLVRWPRTYIVATNERGLGLPITRPKDLTSPDSLRRLLWHHANGLHPFDAERGNNPLLATPDCETFEPWKADEKATLSAPEGHLLPLSLVERFYAPWQVHVIALLRERKYYYVHSRFIRHLDPSHELSERNRLPESTEAIRSLRGMAVGFDALERYRYADQVALNEAFAGVPPGEPLLETARDQLRTWGRQALDMSGVDEPGLFKFIAELTSLIDNYQGDERIALAEDAGQYLLDAQALARDAFQYDWDGFLAAAQDHIGPGLAAELRRLDPVEAAADGARATLKAILSQDPVAAIAGGGAGIDAMAEEMVRFCLDQDLWEVLYSLQRYTYTEADERVDRFPGFRNRRLRPLALAVEQLTRAILEKAANCDHPKEDHSADCPHRKKLRSLIQQLGRGCTWLSQFDEAKTGDRAEDESGDLERRASEMAAEAAAPGTNRERTIALTLAAAVATRNLVSHRSAFLPTAVVLETSGACADAVAVVWLVARSRGLA